MVDSGRSGDTGRAVPGGLGIAGRHRPAAAAHADPGQRGHRGAARGCAGTQGTLFTEQLHAHADAHIFRSLPRTQALRAARLLAEIGDSRGRFPTPEALASLAGVAPSTRQSGESRIVGFHWAVDRQLRDALVEWAGD